MNASLFSKSLLAALCGLSACGGLLDSGSSNQSQNEGGGTGGTAQTTAGSGGMSGGGATTLSFGGGGQTTGGSYSQSGSSAAAGSSTAGSTSAQGGIPAYCPGHEDELPAGVVCCYTSPCLADRCVDGNSCACNIPTGPSGCPEGFCCAYAQIIGRICTPAAGRTLDADGYCGTVAYGGP